MAALSKLAPAVLTAAALLLSACQGDVVYSHYEQMPPAGWEKSEAVSFSMPRSKEQGTFSPSLGLCINSDFPFQSITVVVERQLITHGPSRPMPTERDTVCCRLYDANGHPTGSGISQYQYVFPLRDISISSGDSLAVSISHDMRRQILHGIVNIGLTLTRQP